MPVASNPIHPARYKKVWHVSPRPQRQAGEIAEMLATREMLDKTVNRKITWGDVIVALILLALTIYEAIPPA